MFIEIKNKKYDEKQLIWHYYNLFKSLYFFTLLRLNEEYFPVQIIILRH